MAAAFVFIFLLDYLPGDTLNRTLADITPLGHHITNVRQCGQSLLTDHIISTVNYRLNIKLIPSWRSGHDTLRGRPLFTSDTIKDSSEEVLYQLQTVLENSVENSSSFENPASLFELNKLAENELVEDKSECEIETAKNLSNAEKIVSGGAEVSFPEKVSSLVAIFETLSNVTAQTCGGTLVSPRWVLTAASCIDLLANLYNATNQSALSTYTVIANATDPLVDGSAHRVTRVLLHPALRPLAPTIAGLIKHLHHTFERSKEIATKILKETKGERSPVLALMMVEPPVQVDGEEILRERLVAGEDVVMYGWVLTKNSSGDSMRAAALPAKVLSPAECTARGGGGGGGYGGGGGGDTVCLDTAASITQVSSGGPVVALRGGDARVAGVAQTYERAPHAAHLLAAHAPWLAANMRDRTNT